MKNFLNLILIVNTLYVLAISGNPDLTVFISPLAVFVVAGFLRVNHKQFLNLFKEPNHE